MGGEDDVAMGGWWAERGWGTLVGLVAANRPRDRLADPNRSAEGLPAAVGWDRGTE